MEPYTKKRYKPFIKREKDPEPMNSQSSPGVKTYTLVYQELDFAPEK